MCDFTYTLQTRNGIKIIPCKDTYFTTLNLEGQK